MATTTQKGIKSTSIKAAVGNLENHTTVLQQLKEATEIGQRLRGDSLDSFVRVRELVAAGLIRLTNGVVQPGNTATPTSSVAASRNIFTAGSITGGGDLSIDRTHSLVGDVGSPGNNYFYGTNGAGTKGWFTTASLPVGPTGPQGVAAFLEAEPGEEGSMGPPGVAGPQGAPALPGAAAYGEMGIVNNASATAMTTINTFYQITTGWVSDALNAFTFGSSALTAKAAGPYLVTGAFSLSTATTSNLVVNIQLFKNGVAIATHNAFAKMTNTSDIDSLSITGIIEGVVINDVFDVRIQSTSNSGQSITVGYANLSITAVQGATGSAGSIGIPGLDGEPGEDGAMGPPGPAGSGGGGSGLTRPQVLTMVSLRM